MAVSESLSKQTTKIDADWDTLQAHTHPEDRPTAFFRRWNHIRTYWWSAVVGELTGW